MKNLQQWMRTFIPLWLLGGALGFAAGFLLIAPLMHNIPRALVASLACVVGAFIGGTIGYQMLHRKSNDNSH